MHTIYLTEESLHRFLLVADCDLTNLAFEGTFRSSGLGWWNSITLVNWEIFGSSFIRVSQKLWISDFLFSAVFSTSSRLNIEDPKWMNHRDVTIEWMSHVSMLLMRARGLPLWQTVESVMDHGSYLYLTITSVLVPHHSSSIQFSNVNNSLVNKHWRRRMLWPVTILPPCNEITQSEVMCHPVHAYTLLPANLGRTRSSVFNSPASMGNADVNCIYNVVGSCNGWQSWLGGNECYMTPMRRCPCVSV